MKSFYTLVFVFFFFIVFIRSPGDDDLTLTKTGKLYGTRSEIYLSPAQKMTIYVYYCTLRLEKARGRKTAEKFDISPSTVTKIKTEFETRGEFIVRDLGPPVRDTLRKNEFVFDVIQSLIEQRPDMYLYELAAALTTAFGIDFSLSTVRNRLLELGYSKKRIDRRDSRACSDVGQTNRLNWRITHLTTNLEPQRFIFINESTFRSTDWTRKTSYSLVGERSYSTSQFVSRTNNNVIASHNMNGPIHIRIQQSGGETVTQQFFREYMTELVALPNVGPGTIFVMDNVRSHHDDIFLDNLMARHGMITLFLPQYSPDYNPIEYVFGYVKGMLKSEFHGKLTALQQRAYINEAFHRIPPHIYAAFVNHCHGLWNSLYDHDFTPPGGAGGAGGIVF